MTAASMWTLPRERGSVCKREGERKGEKQREREKARERERARERESEIVS